MGSGNHVSKELIDGVISLRPRTTVHEGHMRNKDRLTPTQNVQNDKLVRVDEQDERSPPGPQSVQTVTSEEPIKSRVQWSRL